MRLIDTPEAAYAFRYREAPPSGNDINGLGVAAAVRARPVFHSAGGPRLEWQGLDDFFSMINPWGTLWQILGNRWQLRRARGAVAERRIAVDDPAAMAAAIKTRARELGAGLAGVTEIRQTDKYEGARVGFKYAVCMGFPMDREAMLTVPHKPAAIEVMRAYRKAVWTAVRLAGHIRALGWPARAYANPNSVDILQIPLAVRAGLGELGKHGSMISREFGSNFRLATVVTDLPMAIDRPVDIGVDDLCLSCRRCVIDCPPDAIFETRQMVRGKRKWYVDFDKCIPYFVKTMACGICIEVCPWSEPGRGMELSRKLLAKRAAGTGPGMERR